MAAGSSVNSLFIQLLLGFRSLTDAQHCRQNHPEGQEDISFIISIRSF